MYRFDPSDFKNKSYKKWNRSIDKREWIITLCNLEWKVICYTKTFFACECVDLMVKLTVASRTEELICYKSY